MPLHYIKSRIEISSEQQISTSTACSIMTRQQKTQASGLGWTSAGLPYIQGVHRNLHTNPVDPSSPLQKLTHTITLFVPCILHSADVWLCPPHAGNTVSVRTTKLNVLVLLTLAKAGESPTCILHERTHPVIYAIEVSHAACKAEFFIIKTFLVDLTADVYFSFI